MSGIVGIWNLNGEPVERSLLARLSATLAHRGPDGEGIQIQGAIGMACQHLQVTPESIGEIQPLVHSSGTMLVFDGRLDNREELLRHPEISSEVSTDSSDAAMILAVYQVFGEKFAEHLNGDFALGLYDPNRQRLVLARDSIGVRPIYYYRTNGLFVFASEIKALLAHPLVSTRPNDDALASFLLGDGGLGDEKGATFFEGVCSIPPAHIAVVTANRFEVHQYWDFDHTQRIRFGSFPEYAEAFRHHFEQAVRRRLRSAAPVAISVSGGLDSSAIFCQAETLRRRESTHLPYVQGISFIYPEGSPADERALLYEIEGKYGVEIQQMPIRSTGCTKAYRASVWHRESPLMNPNQAFQDEFCNLVKQTGAKVLLTGHWGDQMLFNMAYLIDLFHQLAWGKISTHLEEFPLWMTDAEPVHFKRRTFFRNLLRYHVPSTLIPLLRTLRVKTVRLPQKHTWYVKSLQDRACHKTPMRTSPMNSLLSAHAKSLYRTARSSYYVLCMEWNNKSKSRYGIEDAYPFLDRDLISFLMTIPGEIHCEQGVPKALLREAMKGILPTSIRERRWKADFTALAQIEQVRPQWVDFLRPDGLAVQWGYAEGGKIKEKLVELQDHSQSLTYELTGEIQKLFALELWLELFFDSKCAD